MSTNQKIRDKVNKINGSMEGAISPFFNKTICQIMSVDKTIIPYFLDLEEKLLFEISIDKKVLEDKFYQELKKTLNRLDGNRTLWDMKELCRQSCMSENTIKDRFFYEPTFPKYKIGGKWYMPAKQTEEFLLKWIRMNETV